MRSSVWISLVAMAVVLAGCPSGSVPTQVLNRDYLPRAYIPYNPPVGDRGPGWVYEYVESEGGLAQATVCSNLYVDDRAVRSDISLATGNSSRSYSFGVAVSLLQDVLRGFRPGVDATLIRNRSSTLIWEGLQIYEIPAEDRYDLDGSVVTVSPRCRAALAERADDEGNLRGLYVVYEAIRADSTTLTVDWSVGEQQSQPNSVGGGSGETKSSGTQVASAVDNGSSDNESRTPSAGEVSLELDIRDVLEFEAGVTPRTQNARTLTFSQPRFVAYKSMTLGRFLPTGAMAAGRVEVFGEAIEEAWVFDVRVQ